MEHLNCVCKTAVANLGTDKTHIVVYIVLKYDKELAVTEASGTHSLADSSKDKKIIMQHLLNAEVFAYRHNRKHKYFQNVEHSIISTLDKKRLYNGWKNTHTLRNKFQYY